MTSSNHVLVVDDNRAIHDDMRKILCPRASDGELTDLEAQLFGADEGAVEEQCLGSFALQFAVQGRDALQLVERNLSEGLHFALAFVDMRMPPGWDGLETIEHIWKVDPDIQMVICTAYSDHTWNDIARRLKKPDQLFILKKPFDNVEIVQTAHALCKKWELQRELNGRLANLSELVAERTRELQQANDELNSKIDALHRMEAELRLAQKLEGIGQLAAGVAHEINTPAQFVGDNVSFLNQSFGELTDLLKRYRELTSKLAGTEFEALAAEIKQLEEQVDVEYLLEDVPSAIEQSQEGVERITRIVRAMKQFCHPGQEQKTQIDLNEALQNTLTVSRNEWKLVADVETELDAELPAVHCFAGEINQVFLNLIVNAAHAIQSKQEQSGSEKGSLKIRTRAEAGGVEVQIEDSGCGISDSIGKRVFDPFFTTKDVGKGTGQGLAIAHSVVQKHGGRLRFESRAGEGTTFFIWLPVKHAAAEAEKGSTTDTQPAQLESAC